MAPTDGDTVDFLAKSVRIARDIQAGTNRNAPFAISFKTRIARAHVTSCDQSDSRNQSVNQLTCGVATLCVAVAIVIDLTLVFVHARRFVVV